MTVLSVAEIIAVIQATRLLIRSEMVFRLTPASVAHIQSVFLRQASLAIVLLDCLPKNRFEWALRPANAQSIFQANQGWEGFRRRPHCCHSNSLEPASSGCKCWADSKSPSASSDCLSLLSDLMSVGSTHGFCQCPDRLFKSTCITRSVPNAAQYSENCSNSGVVRSNHH